MTYGKCVQQAIAVLDEVGIEDSKVDAYILLEYVTGVTRSDMLLRAEEEMSEADMVRYLELIDRRASRIPLQHLTHSQNFYGYDYYVNEHVLIPRSDTENLIEQIILVIQKDYLPGTDIKLLDMCTGSGCIAITLHQELTKLGYKVDVTGVDISEEALKVARRNAKNITGDASNIHFTYSDLFTEITDKYNIIVSNPPYIPSEDIKELEDEVRLHDPMLALDGDEDGLKFYRSIVQQSSEYMEDRGVLGFEIGYDQAEAVTNLMIDNRYTDIKTYKDLGGLNRVVIGRLI